MEQFTGPTRFTLTQVVLMEMGCVSISSLRVHITISTLLLSVMEAKAAVELAVNELDLATNEY